jgi:Na+/phosphate symporter
MGTKTYNISPFREENRNQVVSYGFTFRELGEICEAIDELIAAHQMWLDDADPNIVKETYEIIDYLTQLEHKVRLYKFEALENKKEKGEEE